MQNLETALTANRHGNDLISEMKCESSRLSDSARGLSCSGHIPHRFFFTLTSVGTSFSVLRVAA
jgi:hypothetical protein